MNLTSRQLEAVRLASQGLTNAGIGARMGISKNAVRNYLMRAAQILDLGTATAGITRTRLAVWYVKTYE